MMAACHPLPCPARLTMRRVLIIDDHPGVGQELELLLSLHDI